MKPERIQSPEAAAITGLSLWNIQSMAARGEIPGAGKLGRRWTFDIGKLRRWITHKEGEACRAVETRRRADFDVRAAWSEKARLEEAYERALGIDPKPKGPRRR